MLLEELQFFILEFFKNFYTFSDMRGNYCQRNNFRLRKKFNMNMIFDKSSHVQIFKDIYIYFT